MFKLQFQVLLLLCLCGCQPPEPRQVDLHFGDGEAVEGAVVRWFAPPESTGFATEVEPGRYSMHGEALAIEICGVDDGSSVIADSLAWIPEGRDSVRVWRRGTLWIDVHWPVGHVEGDFSGASPRPSSQSSRGQSGAAEFTIEQADYAEIVLFPPDMKGVLPVSEPRSNPSARQIELEVYGGNGLLDLRYMFAQTGTKGCMPWLTEAIALECAERQVGWAPASLDQVSLYSTRPGSSESGVQTLEFDAVPLGLSFRAMPVRCSEGVTVLPQGSDDPFLLAGLSPVTTAGQRGVGQHGQAADEAPANTRLVLGGSP